MKTISLFKKLSVATIVLGLAAILISIFPSPSDTVLECDLVKKEEAGGMVIETSECRAVKVPQKGRGALQTSKVTP